MFEREYAILERNSNKMERARHDLEIATAQYRQYEDNLKQELKEIAETQGTQGWPEWAVCLISLK